MREFEEYLIYKLTREEGGKEIIYHNRFVQKFSKSNQSSRQVMVIEIRKEEKQDSNNPTFPLELKIKSQLLLIQPSKKIPRIRSNNSIGMNTPRWK